MLEVASTNVPHMVSVLIRLKMLRHIPILSTAKSVRLSLCHFRPRMISMKGLHLSILNRFALFQLVFSPDQNMIHYLSLANNIIGSLPTDSKRIWNGVQDAHSLFGCRHLHNALWEINLLKESFLYRNVFVSAVFSCSQTFKICTNTFLHRGKIIIDLIL